MFIGLAALEFIYSGAAGPGVNVFFSYVPAVGYALAAVGLGLYWGGAVLRLPPFAAGQPLRPEWVDVITLRGADGRPFARQQVDPEALVLFLCRSAARSDSAARLASASGYANCYNVLEGFEGDRDANNQRNRIGGWRHAGLPWQS